MKKMLLIGWDGYPHRDSGGVVRWQRSLIGGLRDWDFVVLNQLSNPNMEICCPVPKNVTVMAIPLFGTSRYEEYYDDSVSLIPRLRNTSDEAIRSRFVPLFGSFLDEIFSESCDARRLQSVLYRIHCLFGDYDYKKCLEFPETWENFVGSLRRDPVYRDMNLNDASMAFRTIQRTLQLLSVRLPRVDLVQCSLAWTPALLGTVAKRESGCPVVVTEHGVAFREFILYFNSSLTTKPARMLWKIFATNVIRAAYSIADAVVPVSRANASWQQLLGLPQAKMKLIYNGVDTVRFTPLRVRKPYDGPTVVSVARIEPFKDIVCLIQAIKYVKDEIPSVRCLLYGQSLTLDYSKKCANAVQELELAENFKFMGATKEPEKVYNMADVVAISSLTEGLPLTAIEAMACGKAVVAADVGGVREAVEGCGILVRSRRPFEMARGIVTLLTDKRLRDELGAAACKKARAEFSLTTMLDEYSTLYSRLVEATPEEREQEEPLAGVVTEK